MGAPATIDWGSVADWVTAVAAVVGLTFAALQIRALRVAEQQSAAANDASVQIARATLILSIDREYEGETLAASRKALRALRNRAEDVAASKHPGASHRKLAEEAAQEFTRELTAIWAEARKLNETDVEHSNAADRIAADRYAQIMALPYWIETLGMLCQRELLPTDDILDLYDAVIIPTMRNFRDHIGFRREEPPYPNHRFLENAYWLYDRALEFKQQREQPPLHRPVKAGLWRKG